MKPHQHTLLCVCSSYVGRKRMQVQQPEQSVDGVNNLVKADYSYWTLGYALSQQGARKLLAADPFTRMLPVDEFLPVMFNKHPKSVFTAGSFDFKLQCGVNPIHVITRDRNNTHMRYKGMELRSRHVMQETTGLQKEVLLCNVHTHRQKDPFRRSGL